MSINSTLTIENIDVQDYCPIFQDDDIVLCGSLRKQVRSWALEHGIELEEVELGLVGRDVWRIKDQQQRVMFLLRWS